MSFKYGGLKIFGDLTQRWRRI